MIIILILLLSLTAAWAQNPNTAAFPTTIATDQNLGVARRISTSTLSASINSSTLTVNVASGAQFLQYEIIRIDSEEMMICSIASNTLTICTGARGYNGTTAASHTSGSTVYGVITSWHHNQMAAEIKAIETRLSTRVAQCQDAGASDAYACSVAPPITSYTTGLLVNFKANTANTGVSTLNLNSLGAIALKKWSSATLSDTATGDIGAGQWLTVVYDGTYFQIVGGGGGGGSGDVTTTGTNTMTGYTNFSGGTLRLPEKTGATLPAAASNTGKVYRVTDYAGGTCTTGGGSGSQICYSDGTSWYPLIPSIFTSGGISSNSTAGSVSLFLLSETLGLDLRCSATSSSATTYACSTRIGGMGAYDDGTLLVFDVGSTACAGSVSTTLAVDSLSAKRIYRYNGTSDPESADCAANANLLLVYDSSLTGGAGGWRIIGGTPGSAGGGTAVNPYTTTFSSVTSVSVTAATHGQGTKPLVACFDNATPRHQFGCDVSVAANGDVVATFTSSVSGTLEIYGGGGSGDVRTDSTNTYTSGVNDFSAVTLRVPSSITLPATCSVGDAYMDTDATSGQRWYLCESTDTWVQQGGSGNVSLTSGAGAPSASCTAGTSWYLDTTAHNAYFCSQTDTWKHVLSSAAGSEGAIQAAGAGGILADSGCTASSGAASCSGGFTAGDGTVAGELQLKELTANGSQYISLLAPDSLAATTRYLLPSTPPSGAQYLTCGTPSSNISTCSFAGVSAVTKVKRSYNFIPATQNSGGTPVQGSLLSPSSGGATLDAVGTNPWRLGRLVFVDSATSSVAGSLQLPTNWDGGTISLSFSYEVGSGASAGQAVRWRISTVCFASAADVSAPSFNTADVVNVTLASATANTVTYGSIASINTTGCSADLLMGFKFDREGGDAADTAAASAYLSSLRLTLLVTLE